VKIYVICNAMNTPKIFSLSALILLLVFVLGCSPLQEDADDFSEKVKVSLREVGHRLLLANMDSTSVVLPIVAMEESKFSVSFENELEILPNDLVAIIKSSFEKATLPTNYRVEVVQCTDGEVAYSYELKNEVESDLIPCVGRSLPKGCYTLEVKFTNRQLPGSTNPWPIIILGVFAMGVLAFLFLKRKQKNVSNTDGSDGTTIGSFKFYPEQNKLVKKAIEINLSRKECELLELFVARPNQIITRDELTKRVWEDNGVFVGRSLDTYISKLRKKLQGDTSIKLTNVHGVGYKLEINAQNAAK
jgi:DNA-binding winged helix-turn-helix (wHTH) protein